MSGAYNVPEQLKPADVADLRVPNLAQLFVSPFLGEGFTWSGIEIKMGGGVGPCLNTECRGGIVQPYRGHFEECGLCNGSGKMEFGKPYPVLGTVLSVGPHCVCMVGETVVYMPGSFDWVHLPDGRTFGAMDDRAVLAYIPYYGTKSAQLVPAFDVAALEPIKEGETEGGIQIIYHGENGIEPGRVLDAGAGCTELRGGEVVVYDEPKALVLTIGAKPYHLVRYKHIYAEVLEEAA